MERAASPISRRTVVAGLGGLAVTALVATSAFQPSVTDRARRMLASNRFTRRFLSLAGAEESEWAAQVGSEFRVEGGYRMRLAGVRPLLSSGARPANVSRGRAFVAVFEVAGGMTMPSDLIYTAFHSQYGQLPIFLTASADPGRMLAVFN